MTDKTKRALDNPEEDELREIEPQTEAPGEAVPIDNEPEGTPAGDGDDEPGEDEPVEVTP